MTQHTWLLAVFGLGPLEIGVILFIIVLIWGPRRFVNMGKSLRDTFRQTREAVVEGEDEDEEDDDEEESEQELTEEEEDEEEEEGKEEEEPVRKKANKRRWWQFWRRSG